MKTITIGRGPENMVTLNDAKTSRRHALLRCHPTGKMEIVDLSQNGTFVNGMKIPSNKPYPISRKDIIVFAHAETLNWDDVPNPYRFIKISALVLLLCIILLCVGIGLYSFIDSRRPSIEEAPEYVEPSVSATEGKTQEDTTQKAKVKKKIVFPTKSKSKEQTNKDAKEEKKDAEGQKAQGNKQTENNTNSAPEKKDREMNAMW